ncbi:MAG: rubrerythrin [Desulfitibacter sp. BRH_c19]|nr:MAG: rubrerythrin [Desulfitibacter sp. BRH_c19]
MSTEKNLKDAFAGESQANRKYLAFAKKADEDGYPIIAKLFRATAEAETLHAHAHLRTLGAIKSTKENLEAAVEGETYEFTKMYPEFIEEAKQEGNKRAQRSFELANEAEKVHGGLFKKTLEKMDKVEDVDFYLCEVCGNIVENSAPEKCSICGAPASKFKKID